MPRHAEPGVEGHAPVADSAAPAWVAIALWPLGIAVGLAAERTTYDWADEIRWIPDLAVGLVLIGAGAHSMTRRAGTATLLAAAGFAWFLANFRPDAVLLHRALLVHAVLAFAGWRPRARVAAGLVAAGYALALMPAVGLDDAVAITFAGLVVAAAARYTPGRHERSVATAASIVLAIGVTAAAVLRQTAGGVADGRLAWLAYAAAVAAAALVLAAGLPRHAEPVTDRVVELAETTSGTLRDALATVLADPSLEVGYWDGRGYVDASGRELAVPAGGGSRVATVYDRDGEPFAVVVHDASVLTDPVLVEAVASATRLTDANAALQATVRRQLTDLHASRRRLVTTADRERHRLGARLDAGAVVHLGRIGDVLSGESAPGAHRSLALLAQTTAELDQLARGLYPIELNQGLRAALAALAASTPLDVTVSVTGDEPPADIAAAVYFVCAEAVANVVKHAGSPSARVAVAADRGSVSIEVSDEGVGGADVAGGTGLSGIADRVAALDGDLHVESPPTGGTRLVATIPTQVVPA